MKLEIKVIFCVYVHATLCITSNLMMGRCRSHILKRYVRYLTRNHMLWRVSKVYNTMLFTLVFLSIFYVSDAELRRSKCLDIPQCDCYPQLELIDCANRGVSDIFTIPTTVPNAMYRSISLRRNSIKYLDISMILKSLPNLKRVDLRENPLDCAALFKQPTSSLTIKSDCPPPPPTSLALTQVSLQPSVTSRHHPLQNHCHHYH